MTAVIASVLIGACAPRATPGARAPAPPASNVHGSRSDVHAAMGAYAGFTLEDKCRDPDCYGVHGTGTHLYPGLRPPDGMPSKEAIEGWRGAALRALAGLASVHSSGFGAACNDGGLVVWIDDWREVDRALERLGAMLAREDLSEPIGVCVMGRMHWVEVSR
jgi:hypothetical protein